MEQHFEMTFGGVAHHLRERERRVLGPGNSIFARVEGAAEIADEHVRRVFVSVDGSAAEVERRDIGGEFGEVFLLN